MSITRMKLVSIVGPIDKFDDVVRTCITGREFHIENALSVVKDVKGLFPFEQSNPYSEALKRCQTVAEKAGITLDYMDFSKLLDEESDVIAYLDRFESRYSSLLAEYDESKRIISEDTQVLSQLRLLEDINVNLDSLFNFTYVKFRFGRMPKLTYNTYSMHLDRSENVFFMPTSIEKDYVYGMYMMPRVHAAMVDAVFASLHFERIRISGRAHGTPREAAQNIQAEIDEKMASCERLERELADLRGAETSVFLAYYSMVKYKNDTYDIRRLSAHTAESFYLLGWVPKTGYKDFIEALSGFESVTYTSDEPEVLQKTLSPPTKLKNNFFFRPFEDFVGTYGLPDYNEMDPTPFMAITYPLLFGIMFGDVGQGALLVLIGIFIWRFKKTFLAKIISFAGAASVLFGFIYGSVFGNEHILGFGFHTLENNENTNLVLISSIVIGVVLLSTAIIFNIVNGIRQKDPEKILFSASGLAGFVFYWSVILAVVMLFKHGRNLLTPWYILAFVVLPLALIFLRHPLGLLLRRSKDWIPKNKGDFFLTNFFELFEVLISFLSNTISFIRVGAFALNHAGMMLVVYTLADFVGHAGSVPVLIIGNAFVMLLEGLIVGIQVLRLEFYELFGKFYSGTGRPFCRFEVKYRLKQK